MEQQRSAEVRWEWIVEAWKIFAGDPLTWILMQAVVFIFALIGISPIIFLLGGFGVLFSRGAGLAIAGLSLVALVVIPLLILVLIAGGAFLIGGFYRTAIKKARGEAISMADLFSGGDVFLPVLGYLILLVVAMGAIGGVLGVVGGGSEAMAALANLVGSVANVIILGLTIFSLPLIVDRRMGVIEAINRSLELTRSQWWMFALLAFVVEILSGVGIFLCFIGILLTSHFQWTVPAVAYRDVFDPAAGKRYEEFPAPPPPPQYWIDQAAAPPAPSPSSAPPQTAPVVCPHCGATLSRMTNFCNQCGARMT